MGVNKASLLGRAALALVALAGLVTPMTAKADFTQGLSVRAGFFYPQRQAMRNITDFAAWGGGLEYRVGFVPQAFNGDHWTTSISVDFHYSERVAGILRYIPVSLNQIYTFDSQNGHTPYAGFCLTAATYGTTGTGFRQPTVTRFGAGLILGMNFDKHFYLEGRYEWIDKGKAFESPEGFRGYIGYRF